MQRAAKVARGRRSVVTRKRSEKAMNREQEHITAAEKKLEETESARQTLGAAKNLEQQNRVEGAVKAEESQKQALGAMVPPDIGAAKLPGDPASIPVAIAAIRRQQAMEQAGGKSAGAVRKREAAINWGQAQGWGM